MIDEIYFNTTNKHLISFLPKKTKKTSVEYALSARNLSISDKIQQQVPSQQSHKLFSSGVINTSLQLQLNKNEISLSKNKLESTIDNNKNNIYIQKIKIRDLSNQRTNFTSLVPVVKKIYHQYNRKNHHHNKPIQNDTLKTSMKSSLIYQSSLKIQKQKLSPAEDKNNTFLINIKQLKSIHQLKNQPVTESKKYSTSPKIHQQKNISNFKDNRRKQKSLQLPFQMQIRKPNSKKQYFVFGLGENKSQNQNKLELFRDFLWKVNYSNGLYVETPEYFRSYKVYIGKGNNSEIIQFTMKKRFWWTIVDHIDEQGINFHWTQLKINKIFKQQQISKEICYLQHLQKQKQETQFISTTKQKKIFGKKDYQIWQRYMQKFSKFEQTINEQTYYKRIYLLYKKKVNKIEDSSILRIHNHFSENFYIGNKKALFYNLHYYYTLTNKDPFTIIPLTFHLSKGIDDSQYIRFLGEFEKIQQSKKQNESIQNIWIIKPGQNTNRGKGISICYTLNDIKQRIIEKQAIKDGSQRTFILQKYIENPLLYYKRKFDIRHYVLITCINGQYKGYWHQQGYIRTSSSQFTISNNKDPLVHLTNDAIQQHGCEFGKYERGNKVSYYDFSIYLNKISMKQKKYKGNYFDDVILKEMKNYALEAIRATFPLLDLQRRRHNFELLGFDFMIDDNLKPWLIEVNTNPCLQTPCALLNKIIPSLIQNVIRICVDPLFPPPQNWPVNKKMYISENAFQENHFQLIFDEIIEGPNLKAIYQGKHRINGKIQNITQDEQIYQDYEKPQAN